MNRYRVEIGNKDLEVTLLKREGTRISFSANGEKYDVNVSAIIDTQSGSSSPAAVAPLPRSTPSRAAAGSHTSGSVVAPMPGIVVSVNAALGDSVKAGQTLVVIEAMKMENNIACTRNGKIKQIHVKKGDEVQNSQLLIEVE